MHESLFLVWTSVRVTFFFIATPSFLVFRQCSLNLVCLFSASSKLSQTEKILSEAVRLCVSRSCVLAQMVDCITIHGVSCTSAICLLVLRPIL